jgi:hypothetical protein
VIQVSFDPDSGIEAGRVTMIERRAAMARGSHGLGTLRTAPEAVRADVAMATLEQAVAAARAGDHQCGRELCASVLFQIQPMLARHKSLLRTAICALLMSQGFNLLTRVTVALSGERIRVVLWLKDGAPITPPRCQQEAQETIYTIDPRWLAQLSIDDPFLHGWCDALASGRASYGARPAAKRARRKPVPV